MSKFKKKLDETDNFQKHLDAFPEEFWVCGSVRKWQLETWQEKYQSLIDGAKQEFQSKKFNHYELMLLIEKWFGVE